MKQTVESLCESPVSHMLLGLGRITLGWDMANYKFLVQVNGIDHSELKKFVKQEHISREKVLNSFEGNVR